MDLPSDGVMLRIIIGENSRHEGKRLYEWIVLKARKYGMAGATVSRAMMGYGAHSRIKTSSILCLSEDLPVIIEIVDCAEMIEQFLELIEPSIKEGLVTVEKTHIRMYRGRHDDI